MAENQEFGPKIYYAATEGGGSSEETPDPNREAYASRMASREEEFAKRDPILERLTNARSSKDIAESLRVLSSFEDFDKAEANDPYSLRYYIRAAFSGQQAFSKTNDQLMEEGIVQGKIGEDGGLQDKIGEDGGLQERGKIVIHGYTLRVDTEIKPKGLPIPHEKRVLNEDGSTKRVEKWEDIPKDIPVERPYFGEDKERKALARAYEAAVDMFVIRERIHTLFTIFDEHKADLNGMVTLFYQRAPLLTNAMHQKIFTMPDIGAIDRDHLDNQKFGRKVNLAMRLFYVVGNCETREKMEALMKRSGYEKLVQELQQLRGEGIMGKLIGQVENWFTKEERDPSLAKDDKEVKKRGGAAIDYENGTKPDEAGAKNVRGELTAYGNVFASGSLRVTDNETRVVKAIEQVVGDPDAVRVAHRLFKLWGLADRFGVEIYGTLPTSEQIIAQLEAVQSGKQTYEQWRKQAKKWSNLFSIPGDPVSSDLSKLLWPQYWRLKEVLKDRPTGAISTIDKIGRLCLSLPELAQLETDYGPRSLDEVWWGYEDENALDLGEVDWLAIKSDTEVGEALEHLEDSSEYLKGRDRRVRHNAWALYTLFLYLVGEDKPEKRPWAYLNFEDYNPQDFLKNSFFSGKVKFLGITINSTTSAEGNFRAIAKGEKTGEKDWAQIKRDFESQTGGDPTKVTDVSQWEAEQKIERIKRAYWAGVLSLPQARKIWVGTQLYIPGAAVAHPYLMDEANFLAKKYGYR